MQQDGHYCACKGIRTCLFCEKQSDLTTRKHHCAAKSQIDDDTTVLTFCSICSQAWETTVDTCQHSGESLSFPGVELVKDFITEDEESALVQAIDQSEWTNSQSGRRKQDYGPKVNFKKKKLKSGVFTGLPAYSRTLVQNLADIPILQQFRAVELCNLEYIPGRGSSIDPHYDDFWLWGEHLVTLNLLSDTCYTMTLPPSENKEAPAKVKIPFPRRSLLVLHGQARHVWQHSIGRDDIHARRIGITMRELTDTFLDGGPEEQVGKRLLETAFQFQGMTVAEYETRVQHEQLVNGTR